ncbi:AAA family ATPase [Burkholderia gladioli]|uniref:AAA family ATPase n=1 Tax=Burkholderia gladioli TaxID=28095 RepID=UPI00163EC2F2|nr:AAA family ATPase [Burkholderia gladioli]
MNLKNMTFPSPATAAGINLLTSADYSFPEDGKNGIILYGPYGTGKSTCAELLPAEIEAKHSTEAALIRYEECSPNNNGVALLSSIRTQISLVPTCGELHYVILDEVDNLTHDAMKQLKSTMNRRYGSQHHDAVFIMTTNHLDKIDEGVIKRSRLVSFEPMNENVWIPLARQTLQAKGVDVSNVTDRFIRTRIIAKGNNPRDILDNCKETAYLLKTNPQWQVIAGQP